MTEKKSREDVLALLDAYAENALEELERREVHQALLEDESLRKEYEEVKLTMEILREFKAPVSPIDMAKKVRARLNAEVREAEHSAHTAMSVISDEEVSTHTPSLVGNPIDNVVPISWGRRAVEVGLAMCATAAVVVGVMFSGANEQAAEGEIHAAGIARKTVMTSTFNVRGIEHQVLVDLAVQLHLEVTSTTEHQMVIMGDGAAALAFCQQARSLVAKKGQFDGLNPSSTGKVRLVLSY